MEWSLFWTIVIQFVILFVVLGVASIIVLIVKAFYNSTKTTDTNRKE